MQRDSGSTRIFKLFSSSWFLSLRIWGYLREKAGVSRAQETDLLCLFGFFAMEIVNRKTKAGGVRGPEGDSLFTIQAA